MDRPQVGDQLHHHRRPAVVTGTLTHDERLRDVLAAMYGTGRDAQERHDEAVENLRREPREMTVAIIAAYGRCPAGDYPGRQALVYAAGVMRDAGTLPFLASVALSEVPPEASSDSHSFSTVAEETIIRMSAVDGIAYHASRGDKEALEILLRCVESRAFSVRRAAVTGLLATEQGKKLRPRLEAMIPKEQHFVFHLKQIHVSEAIQVKDPRRHLVEGYQEFGERKPEVPGPRRGRTPKTKKKK
jgi:hypothetical protein